jgi:uncharacterized LabA/DUF88 family protein
MTNKKVSIFVDWENVRKSVFEEAYKTHKLKVDYNDVPTVKKFISSFLLPDEEIYRIFFYLSDPFKDKIAGIDYSKTKTFSLATAFIERLSVTDNIAVRKGYLAYRGMDIGKRPIFNQKQVDMLLGLDIAHVSYNHLADRILLLSADTDIVPAMKTARINGLQVIFGYCGDIQNDIHRKLKEHSDFIRSVNFKSIFPPIALSKP